MKCGSLWKSTRFPFGSFIRSFAGLSIERGARGAQLRRYRSLRIKDQRKGSQCPVSGIKVALRREWANALAFFNARTSRVSDRPG